jgi:hypothetical protein
MQLVPGVSIESTTQVTRQTIYNLVSNALGGTVNASDLDSSVITLATQSDAPALAPGLVWFDQTDQVLKVFTDVIDGTGCSCWLAFGPDRFEIALLADEPIPFGAAVQLNGENRHAKLPPDPLALTAMTKAFSDWEAAKVVGFNNTGHKSDHATAASGTWFSCAVDGLVWAWYPCNVNNGGNYMSSLGDGGFDGLINSVVGLTGPSGISNVRGGVMWVNVADVQANAIAFLLYSTYAMTAGQDHWARRPFSGPRVMKH